MPDIESYIRALEARGALKDCPSCGHDVWGSASEGMLIHAYDELDDLTFGKGYGVIALICENCGFVRMHFTPVLERDPDGESESPGEQ